MYVSRIKWSNPGKVVAPSVTPRCSSYWKGSLLVALNYVRWLYLLTIYIYIYIYIYMSVYLSLCLSTYPSVGKSLFGFIYQFIFVMYVRIYVSTCLSIRLSGLVDWVFVISPRDRGSIRGRVIPKTQKMVLDTSWLNTQYYNAHIEGKAEQSRERSIALSSVEVEGRTLLLRVTLDYGRQLFLYIYIYVCVCVCVCVCVFSYLSITYYLSIYLSIPT